MEEEQNTNKRHAIVSFLLSIWTPGLGQIYNGQIRKGIVLSVLTLFCYLLFVANIGTSFYGFVTTLFLIGLIRIYGIVDAIIWSRRLKNYTFKKFNSVGFYIVFAVCIIGIPALIVFGGFAGTQSFTIPTSGCSPTIMASDYVVMNKRAYNSAEIKCGDLVAYNAEDGQIYMSRVIGLPNDVLSVVDDIVTINGKESQSIYVRNTRCDKLQMAEYTETLPNGVKHNIYKRIDPLLGRGEKSDTANIIVPSGCYFLMGDNRDGSLDSRYRGPVKKEDILGQMVYVLYRNQGKKKGIKFNIDLRN